MLPHEIREWGSQPAAIASGFDELYDATSTPLYTYYGLAILGTGIVAANQSAAIWFIIVYKNNADGSPAAVRYYPPNQIWANRTSLTLP